MPAPAEPGGLSPPTGEPQRPEGLPDHFWDPSTGIRTNELVAAFNELSAEQTKLGEVFKDFPKDPKQAGEFYKLPEAMLPEGMTLPEGVAFEPNTELLGAALPILHKHRIAPAAFHELTQAFNAYELQKYNAATAEFAADAKKLGANGDTRRKAVADGIAAIVGPERAAFIDTRAITSQAVEFFEAVLAKVSGQSSVIPLQPRRDADPAPPPQSVEQRWYGATQKAS